MHAYVVGEHGDSEVLPWSRVTIGGTPLEEVCTLRNIVLDSTLRHEIDDKVRFAGRDIIAGKGATYYGIGSALARIVSNIANDRRAIMTVCTPMAEVAGVADSRTPPRTSYPLPPNSCNPQGRSEKGI